MDVATLEAQVRYHDARYWVDDSPEIPDTTFDLLVETLRAKAPTSEVLLELGGLRRADADAVAPTTVDPRTLPTGAKFAHRHPMLSLDKCYTEAELLRWFSRFEGDAVASPKIDGVALSIRYDAAGRLEVAVTRGNGSVGDVVTENAKRVAALPLQIPASGDVVEVRGEVYLPLSIFQTEFASQFANPRNLAAGALKQKDANKTAGYKLRFAAYDVEGVSSTTESDKRRWLREAGFVPVLAVTCSASSGQAVYERFVAERGTLDFETDGVVFKVNDVAQHELMGLTAHHPRFAIAYKYQGDSGLTTLEDIEWSVSRTGAINPVAIVSPVSLSGVTVTRASLHNLGIIASLADQPLERGRNWSYPLSAGARLMLTRRGGVIPHVEHIVEKGVASLEVPERCPSCDAVTVRRDDFLFAEHLPNCATQQRRALEHFVSVAEIQGIGPRLMEQLLDRGLVIEPADLFTLTASQIQSLERLGERSAANVIQAIDARRTIDAGVFLAALGLPDVGRTIAPVLLRGVDNDFGRLRTATVEELVQIDGVGEAIAMSVVDGLAAGAARIDALLQHVTLRAPTAPAAPSVGPLTGLSFVFTGTLEAMDRKAAQARVRALGATTPDDVSRTTRYLVIGDADFAKFQAGWRSSKLKKADRLVAEGAALEVISETDFLALLPTVG